MRTVSPLVLYNPPHAKRVLSPADIEAVTSSARSVVGVKLGDGDAEWYASARKHLSRLSVFVPGHHLATGMREGVAAGAFSNVACLSPAGAQRWTASMATDLAGALELETRLCAFMDEWIVPFRRDHGYANAALDKLLTAIGGWGPVGTRLRRPYRWIAQEEADRLRPIARAMLPELFAKQPSLRRRGMQPCEPSSEPRPACPSPRAGAGRSWRTRPSRSGSAFERRSRKAVRGAWDIPLEDGAASLGAWNSRRHRR